MSKGLTFLISAVDPATVLSIAIRLL